MSPVALFIRRPVATTLLAIGLGLAGFGALLLLPVAPLPNIDMPTITVTATMPGASPEVMANTVATPLERHLGVISGVTQMPSSISVGTSRVVLQFDISRDIDGAARDVQAAINAAHADLPTSLRSNPTYNKFNPASFPIMILALTSKTLTPGQIYDQTSNVLQQKLSQITGVGDVSLAGAALPAVRIELNPQALFKYGIGLDDVRAAISSANAGANSPKGAIDQGTQRLQVYSNDNASAAVDYQSLIIAYRDNAPVRLEDVADVYDGVENIRNMGMANGSAAVLVLLTQQPGANVIQVVDNINQMIPQLQHGILPPSIDLTVIQDTTVSIRNSVRDVEITLVISTILVVLVVFLRNWRATLVPGVSVPLSLLGTFGCMYMLGFTLDNFSLMALIISTGFVVDNTIVVLENVTRHRELGESQLEAALKGSQEVAFTVISMSVSLGAVFLPILLMGGILGRLFHEFAVTLAAAIFMSLLVSLTVTPMMCAYLDFNVEEDQNWLMRGARTLFDKSLQFYCRSLVWSLDNPKTIMFSLLVVVVLNFYPLGIIPKGFFPEVDEGRIMGNIRGDQSISYQSMVKKFIQFGDIIRADPAVAQLAGSIGSGAGGRGGGATNTGTLFITLKSPAARGYVSSDEVIDRLRPKLNNIAGARMFMMPMSSTGVRSGGRQGNGSLQYTIQADDLSELNQWVPKITDALQNVPELEDVNSDQQDKGLEVNLKIDRTTESRLGLTVSQVDNTLYDAFGQRQVSTIYKDKNQYHVIMEVAPSFWQSPETLRDIYVSTAGVVNGTQTSADSAAAFSGTATSAAAGGSRSSGASTSTNLTAAQSAALAVRNQQLNSITSTTGQGSGSTGSSVATAVETMVPLSSFVSYGPGTTPLSVNHQGPFVATTFSFNLPQGVTEDQATQVIDRTMAQIRVPIAIHGEPAGTLQLAKQSLSNLPLLFLAAILTIYIVLGILYESYVHPLTILSTLPSAGVGAVLALLVFKTDFSLIAFIGVILLIGVVKKNAIIMIDFAIEAERRDKLESREAIYRACLLRFRPIMMTTMGAILGALPLAIGLGEGSEMRRPLGISIVGGLLLSQALTLYTTPVVYLYLDRWRLSCLRGWNRWYHGRMGAGHGQEDPQPAE